MKNEEIVMQMNTREVLILFFFLSVLLIVLSLKSLAYENKANFLYFYYLENIGEEKTNIVGELDIEEQRKVLEEKYKKGYFLEEPNFYKKFNIRKLTKEKLLRNPDLAVGLAMWNGDFDYLSLSSDKDVLRLHNGDVGKWLTVKAKEKVDFWKGNLREKSLTGFFVYTKKIGGEAIGFFDVKRALWRYGESRKRERRAIEEIKAALYQAEKAQQRIRKAEKKLEKIQREKWGKAQKEISI